MDETQIQEHGYYRSLTKNMAITMMVVSILPLILISAITRHYFLSSYRDKVRGHLTMLISRHQETIDDFIEDRLNAIKVQAQTLDLDGQSQKQTFTNLLTVLQGQYGNSLTDLGILNEQGARIAYAGPFTTTQTDYSKAEWFRVAMTRGWYIGDVLDAKEGATRFVIAARKERDGKRWVLYTEILSDALFSLLDRIRADYGGKGFIINERGAIQAQTPRGAVDTKDPWLEFARLTKVPSGEVRIAEIPDQAGVNNFCLMAGLKHGEWRLCYVHGTDETYAAMYDARRFSIATLVISVIAIVAMSVVFSKRIIKHIATADQDKRSMNEQLIEAGKLASLGEMAAGIAHEINNPVGIMVQEAGWIQDLVDDYEQDPEAPFSIDDFKRSLTRIQTQGRRCKEITHQLLSFARKTDHTRRDAQLNELIEEVVALSAGRARHSNVQIVKKLQEDLPKISISPSELQQVLLNLMNNSLDAFDSRGGTIDIATSLGQNNVLIEIADNGPGIAKENLNRVFEPFFTTKPVGKGTGLGLSICYGIVKNMGGEITVASEQGKGTAFQIVIPLKGKSRR